jgi:hypothetical protein
VAIVTNLSQGSIKKLASCDLKTQRIGIQRQKDPTQQQIVIIEKADYTPFNRFKSCFGCGPLAKADFRLREVSHFLATTSLRHKKLQGGDPSKLKDPNAEQFRAYLAAAGLANKLFHLTHDATAMEKLSSSEFRIVRTCPTYKVILPLQMTFYYNPAMTVQDFQEAMGVKHGFLNLSEFEIRGEDSNKTLKLCESSQVLTRDLFSKIHIVLSNTDILSKMADYDPRTQRIGFRKNDPLSSPIILEKSDFTWWNRLLGRLGYGKLAGIDYSLQSVLKYLKRHRWVALDESSHKAVYHNVFALAIKALHSKSAHLEAKRWLAGLELVEVHIRKDVKIERKEESIAASRNGSKSYSLPWYETMKVKDIQKYLGGNSVKLYVNKQLLDPEELITKEQLRKASITVSEHL